MTDTPAILATFSDWRTVKTRKVLQLVFEVPIEKTAEVLTTLGAPMPHEERWCAIALLMTKNNAPVAQLDEHRSSNAADAGSSPAGCANSRPDENASPFRASGFAAVSPRAAEDSGHTNKPRVQSLSSQCALRCKDKRFWEWLRVASEEAAADWVREHCEIQSRSQLDSNFSAASDWRDMERAFQNWLTQQAHGALAR